MWALVKRDILDAIKRNQPAPTVPFIAGLTISTGLRKETLERYIKDMIEAKLVRMDENGLHLEESAEVLLGFK